MRIILKERKDFETQVTTKKVLYYFKKCLLYLSGDISKTEVNILIPHEQFPEVLHKFPKHFRGIKFKLLIDDDVEDFRLEAFADRSISNGPNKVITYSIIQITMAINSEAQDNPDKFLREEGSAISSEMKMVLRHEFEHIYQDLSRREDTDPKVDPFRYYYSDEEVDAYITQLVRYSKHRKLPFKKVFDFWLDNTIQILEIYHNKHPIKSKWFSKSVDEEIELIKNKMIKRIKEIYPKIII